MLAWAEKLQRLSAVVIIAMALELGDDPDIQLMMGAIGGVAGMLARETTDPERALGSFNAIARISASGIKPH
jgi:hypothetical protein